MATKQSAAGRKKAATKKSSPRKSPTKIAPPRLKQPREVRAARDPARRDRVLFPQAGFSRNDAAEYYRAIARFLLPHLKDRPLSYLRYPSTIEEAGTWEKNVPPFAPPSIKTFPVPRKTGSGVIDYIVVNDLRTLLWLVDHGAIELHPFLHKVPNIKTPTHAVFDLDPGTGAGLRECAQVALIVRDFLQRLQLDSLVKASGSKGLQLYVPLNDPAVTHELAELLAQAVAEQLARNHPKLIVAKMQKQLRSNRVFIDWSQNADYKTTVAVYSLRTKRNAPFVSMPLDWSEVEALAEGGDTGAVEFTPEAALQRVRERGDLFKPLLTLQQQIPEEFRRAIETRPPAVDRRSRDEEKEVFVNGIPLPRQKSQSGRRLFVLVDGKSGNELWLEYGGEFSRWILRKDREEDGSVIAMPAGQFPAAASYYRGEVQAEYRDTVKIVDIGGYERIDGAIEAEGLTIFLDGSVMSGRWRLEKIEPGTRHRSWRLAPIAPEKRASRRARQ